MNQLDFMDTLAHTKPDNPWHMKTEFSESHEKQIQTNNQSLSTNQYTNP